MPIEFFSVDDVWTYLLQVDSPWGTDNLQLANLYRSAQAGECPLVIDKTTPSCGNSRFGCWTCTVVSKDRSMEAMIDAGDEWMIPLLDFRDWLASTQDPAVKPGQREYKSRNGRIKITGDGQLRYRTYTLEFSREMLRRLLQTELEVQKYEPQFSLISVDELKEIRRLWVTERRDWDDSVPSIYAEAVGKDVRWEDYDDLNRPGRLEADLLRKAAEKENLPLELLQKLLDAEWQHYGMQRRAKIHTTIASIFNEDWRTLEEVEEEMERRQLKSAGA